MGEVGNMKVCRSLRSMVEVMGFFLVLRSGIDRHADMPSFVHSKRLWNRIFPLGFKHHHHYHRPFSPKDFPIPANFFFLSWWYILDFSVKPWWGWW